MASETFNPESAERDHSAHRVCTDSPTENRKQDQFPQRHAATTLIYLYKHIGEQAAIKHGQSTNLLIFELWEETGAPGFLR